VGSFERFVNKVKRAETPTYRLLKGIVFAWRSPSGPRIPDFVKPVGRLFYHLHYLAIGTFRTFAARCYYHPLFQSRCSSVGKHLLLEGLPFVNGPVELYLGDNVVFGGRISILSGRVCERPRLVMKDRSGVGWDSTIVVNREVLIDEDVIIAPGCRISDTDGHPRDALQRAAHMPPDPSEVKAVHICRYAWIGACSHIMKGVTIGEGAIIGANSVVISDIPPYSIALGNPAEVFFRNIQRKARTGD
jgi:acetyltransferase-like isoleucine patch superfamily enzyme